ncbi:MAG: protease modulator HflK N-terminal domain-containing protein [Pseudomonadota bacterium]
MRGAAAAARGAAAAAGSGNGGGPGPWGRGPSGGGSGPTPPNIEELLRRGQERMRGLLPGGMGSLRGLLLIGLIAVGVWLASGIYRVQPEPLVSTGTPPSLDGVVSASTATAPAAIA